MSSNKKRRLPLADISNSTRCTSGDVLYSPFKIQVCTSKVSPRTTPIGPGKYVLRGRNAYRITDGNNLTSQFNVGMSMDIHGCG
ncbi:hypothetical protein P8452_46451 [Trifolium repens]|nr:hypothetical protein P8452_46451 [Trifolium repens]